MKWEYFAFALILSASLSCVSAETFTPDEGIFAFREVEIFEINGINFTVPTDYGVSAENSTSMNFRHANDTLNISVVENGTIKEIEGNASINLTAETTMFGSIEGFFVDNNGTYSFSYIEDDKLVVLESEDTSLMMGAIGKD